MTKLVDQMLDAVLRGLFAITPRRWLGSLSWHVEQFLRPWKESAADLQKSTWFERVVLGATESPWKFLVVATLIWTSIAVSVGVLVDYECLPLIEWEQSDQLSYFGTAWSVQATVVALVYPLVISFVTFLLQRRATARVALTAYLLETGAKLSVASSFALLVLMTLQYLVLPWISILNVQALMVANIAWLAINLFLTAWFLACTARYLQDERRVRTLQWLTQCVTLPREVQAYAKGLLLQNAQKRGWVPGDSLSENSLKPKVYLFPMSEGRAVSYRCFSVPKELQDVHFKPLGWAISRWTLAAKSVRDGSPLLELPCTPNDPAEEHVLYRVRDAEPPNRLAALAIRASYQFVRPEVSAMPFTSLEVMNELSQEASAQAELRRDSGFRQALDDLVAVHTGLLRAARVRSSDGSLDSVSLLSDPYGWGSRPMLRDWMSSYRLVAEAAVGALVDDARFFLRTAALSGRLTHRAGEQPEGVLVPLMLPSTLLMYHLSLWWSRHAATEPTLQAHAPRLLSAPLRTVYREALQEWVGSWESIHVSIGKDVELHGYELWRAHATRVRVYAAHLDETARVLLSAVARGDAEAARRFEVSLIKWWSRRQHEFKLDHRGPEPGWTEFTLALAELNWDEAKVRIPDLPEGPQAEDAATRLLSITLQRYWSDVCMVVALVLLESATAMDQPEESLCVEIVGALLSGQGYDEGGTVDSDLHHDAGSAAAQLARSQFSDRAYSNRLDKIVQTYRSDTRETWTSGRTYLLVGSEDVDSLIRGQAIYLAALVAGNHDQLRAFKRLVDGWSENLQRLGRVQRHFESIAAELRREEFGMHFVIVEKLRAILGRSGAADVAVEGAATVCGEAANAASTAHEATINDAQLDPARLIELAQQVHAHVFTNDEGAAFPIAATKDFLPTDDEVEAATLSFERVSKLIFTSPQHETLDDHLVRLFSEYTAHRAFAVAVEKLQRKLGIEPVRDDRADAFYADLKGRIAAVVAKGWTPIILVASGRRADYLAPYRLPEDGEVAAGFDIRPPDIPERGLHALVNDVKVYSVSRLQSRYLVLPEECVKTMRFQQRQAGTAFSVKADGEAAGKINLTFEFACEFVVPSNQEEITQHDDAALTPEDLPSPSSPLTSATPESSPPTPATVDTSGPPSTAG